MQVPGQELRSPHDAGAEIRQDPGPSHGSISGRSQKRERAGQEQGQDQTAGSAQDQTQDPTQPPRLFAFPEGSKGGTHQFERRKHQQHQNGKEERGRHGGVAEESREFGENEVGETDSHENARHQPDHPEQLAEETVPRTRQQGQQEAEDQQKVDCPGHRETCSTADGDAQRPMINAGLGPRLTFQGTGSTLTHMPTSRSTSSLRIALALLALAYPAAFLLVALSRLGYPFELEWMEGGVLDHVRRILAGQPLYVAPSVAFVPFMYTPLYYYAVAPLAGWLGTTFLPLRLFSTLCACGTLAGIYLLIRRETGRSWCGLLAACFFAAVYRTGGAWFDLARVDSLFLLLLLLSIVLLRLGRGRRGQVAAAGAAFLTVMTKQSALFVFAPLLLLTLLRRPRRPFFAAAFGFLLLAGTVLLNLIHRGWFLYYVFQVPRGHPIVPYHLYYFWTRDLLGPLGIAAAVGLISLVIPWQAPADPASAAETGPVGRPDRDPTGAGRTAREFYGVAVGGMLISSWLSRVHAGGAINVVLPAYLGISLLFGLAIGSVTAAIQSSGAAERRKRLLLLDLVCLLQFLALLYDPRELLPRPSDRAAGERLVATLRAIPGSVLVPAHGYLAQRAGKEGSAHEMAMDDLFRGNGGGPASGLKEELRTAVRERRFEAIVLDDAPPLLPETARIDLTGAYTLADTLLPKGDLFRPTTGSAARPRYLYRRGP
jgi:hypothetical protein